MQSLCLFSAVDLTMDATHWTGKRIPFTLAVEDVLGSCMGMVERSGRRTLQKNECFDLVKYFLCLQYEVQRLAE